MILDLWSTQDRNGRITSESNESVMGDLIDESSDDLDRGVVDASAL